MGPGAMGLWGAMGVEGHGARGAMGGWAERACSESWVRPYEIGAMGVGSHGRGGHALTASWPDGSMGRGGAGGKSGAEGAEHKVS